MRENKPPNLPGDIPDGVLPSLPPDHPYREYAEWTLMSTDADVVVLCIGGGNNGNALVCCRAEGADKEMLKGMRRTFATCVQLMDEEIAKREKGE